MEKTRLGKTNLMVTRIGFGALPIQAVDRDSAVKVTRYAYEQGINFFDTARAYTTSESDLGRALGDLGSEVIVATKAFYKNMEQFDEDFNTSLNNLQRDYIDLFQFHLVNEEDQLEEILKNGGPLDYLAEEKRKGRVKHIGITSHRPSLMPKALESGAFETVQIPLNYIENEPLEELIPLARSMDIGIIAMKPLAGGVFTNNRAAVKWVLEQAGVVPIPGMRLIEEVDDILPALKGGPNSQELAQLETDWHELGTNFCRRCNYCMPCPNDIEASFIVRAGLYFKRVGWDKMEEKHVGLFEKGLECDRCGTCEAKCPYELPLTDLVIEESKNMLNKAVELGVISEAECREKINRAEKDNNR
ncbi:MAG: aldo/keto reductase [Bacillota bacterium]